MNRKRKKEKNGQKMKLVLINKREAKILGLNWNKPANQDKARVKKQDHRPFLVPNGFLNHRKGIKVTRKSFRSRPFYRAFPDTSEKEKKLLSRLSRLANKSVDELSATLDKMALREQSRVETRGDEEERDKVRESKRKGKIK